MSDERHVVGEADAETRRKMIEKARQDARKEAAARLYQKPTTVEAAKVTTPPGMAVDAMRGVDALLNRKKYMAKALKDAGV